MAGNTPSGTYWTAGNLLIGRYLTGGTLQQQVTKAAGEGCQGSCWLLVLPGLAVLHELCPEEAAGIVGAECQRRHLKTTSLGEF